MELNGTIFLQICIFLALLLWLSRSLFDPILQLFEEREKRINGAKEDAILLSERALEKAQSFDQQYEKARDDARHSLSHLKKDLEKEHLTMISRAKTQARERVEKASLELQQQEKEMRTQLASSSELVATEIVNSLLRAKA